MPKAKKKLLPKDFKDLLTAGDPSAIKAVFETCDVNARGGYSKQTALAFNECPDDLARWLVEQGADIAAVDSYGETPLHSRAGHWQGKIDILLELGADVHRADSKGNTPLHRAASIGNCRTAQILLAHGARVDALNNDQLTPVALALRNCSNAKIREIAAVSALLLDKQPKQPAGLRTLAARLFGGPPKSSAPVSPDLRGFVQRIGTNFEFHRSAFNPDDREATSDALDTLYALFDVPPVPRRAMHDGTSPIVAKAADWQGRHQELWELLVPSSGAAATVQGEVIRISGRIANELDGNGGINWGADFKLMADALLTHLRSGTPLPDTALKEAAALVSALKRKYGDTQRLSEWAVEWVALNPNPVALPPPAYGR